MEDGSNEASNQSKNVKIGRKAVQGGRKEEYEERKEGRM
jgi:hypothetical protein